MSRSTTCARRSIGVLAVALVAVTTLVGAASRPAVARYPAQRLAVPAYFSAGGEYWGRLGDGGGGLAVANLANGPGTAYDRRLAGAIRSASDAGIRVLGYVDTGYFGVTGRPTRAGATTIGAWRGQARADIDAWYSRYGGDGLAGVFFDRALADCGTGDAHVTLYTDLDRYAKDHHGALTVDNPGRAPEECYARAADVLVTFEGTYADYRGWTAPGWELCPRGPVRFWHLVYATGAADVAEAMALSRQRNASFVYVTPDGLPNPWDSLPAYWNRERDLAGTTRSSHCP
jgi:spherulation-specific family 4 protein